MDANTVAAISGAVGALVAAVAATFAFLQLRQTRLDALDARAGEIAGVSLTFRVLTPRHDQVFDGTGDYRYVFTVQNPGRLPISHVRVTLHFPGTVQRVRGALPEQPAAPVTLELAADTVVLSAPAVAAHGTRDWERTLRMPIALGARLEGAAWAEVAFRTVDVGDRITRWPPLDADTDAQGKLVARLPRAVKAV